MTKTRRVSRLSAAAAACLVACLLSGCGGSSGSAVSTKSGAAQRATDTTFRCPTEDDETTYRVGGPSTADELVNGAGPFRPAAVGLIEVTGIVQEPRAESRNDEAGSRRLLTVKMVDALNPEQNGETFVIHESTDMYNPSTGQDTYRVDLPCYRFEVGDRAVASLIRLGDDKDYKFFDTKTGFYVVENGRLAHGLAAARSATDVRDYELIRQSDGVTVDEFMAILRAARKA